MTPEQQTPASVVERLTDPNFAGPMQHLRDWSELDRLHAEAAAMIERLLAERQGLREALADGRELVARWLAQSCEDDAVPELQAASRSHLAAAALTQGESRQTGACQCSYCRMGAADLCRGYAHNLPAAPTPDEGGGE